MNILVTGANSYLGGHVCQQLVGRGHTVFGLDSHERAIPVGGVYRHIPPISAIPKGQDYRLVDAVVHMGWYSKAGDEEREIQIDCIRRTQKLLFSLAIRKPPPRFVFTSTASVYSQWCGSSPEPTPTLPPLFKETDVPRPMCCYTQAKLGAEELIKAVLPSSHLILRLGSLMGVGANIVGNPSARTKLDVVVNAFACDGYRKGIIEVWSPDAWKPVIHVQDAAEVLAEAVERQDWLGTVNVASTCIRAIDIAKLAAHLTGAEIHITTNKHSSRSCRVDNTLLNRELPGLDFYTVEESIQEFKDYHPGPRDYMLPWTSS